MTDVKEFNHFMMRKALVVLFILFIAPIIAGIYGVIHDQITYTISSEYYTKFKFFQFGLARLGDEAIFPNPRLQVCAVGILATWWMGPPIALILALVGLRHRNHKQMLRITLKSMTVTMVIAFITGLVGLIYGRYYLADTNVNWYFPANLVDRRSFVAVGSMHNFSYLGGAIGLLAGIIYSIKERNAIKRKNL